MTKKTIVTLSDSNYYPLLEELIHSIRKFKESENINICVLDAGLNSSQVDKISFHKKNFFISAGRLTKQKNFSFEYPFIL